MSQIILCEAHNVGILLSALFFPEKTHSWCTSALRKVLPSFCFAQNVFGPLGWTESVSPLTANSILIKLRSFS